MNDTFERRLGAAEWAAWWAVAVWWILLTLFWCVSMVVVHFRPPWVMGMLGDGITWAEYQSLRLWFTGAFKALGCVAALVALFLTLWRRGLKRLAGT